MIIYVDDLLHYMEVHKSHHECTTYDWWAVQKGRLFLDVFNEWTHAEEYNPKETAEVVKIYWERIPKSTRKVMLNALKQGHVQTKHGVNCGHSIYTYRK